MNTIKRHSVFLYFLLTFIISWGGLIWVVGGFGQLTVLTDSFNSLLPLVIFAILAGPSLSGLTMAVLTDGKNGRKEYKTHLFKRGIEGTWYIISLLTGPLVMGAIYAALSLFSADFIPAILIVDNKTNHLIAGIMTGLAAGFFEEIGWTGFAIPQLRKKYGIVAVGLIVGLVWALWHTLPGLWLGYASGTVTSTPLLFSYFADSFLFLVVYRVLMVWVYDKTESLFIAMIMHGSLTAAARIITPIGLVGTQLLIFDLVWVTSLALITYFSIRRR